MSDPFPSLASLITSVASELHDTVSGSQEYLRVDLGPFDEPSQAAVLVLLLEVSNAVACCASGAKGNEGESRGRILNACESPWALHYLRMLHPLLSVGTLCPEQVLKPSGVQAANLRLKWWTCPPAQ